MDWNLYDLLGRKTKLIENVPGTNSAQVETDTDQRRTTEWLYDSDASIEQYADNYFEYDPTTQQVTLEISAVCDSCPGGGTTSDRFTYTPNPNLPVDGFNIWALKTVQTLPDSSTMTVYTNYAGQPMLKVRKDPSGTSMWCTFFKYDATTARVLWRAEPSAVSGYDDTYDDLLNYDSGTDKYQYLRDSDGLIHVSEYYNTTDIPNGKAEGYLAKQMIRKGQTGSDVLLREYLYTSHTDANSVTVYPIWKSISYPDDTTTATKIITEFSYDDWYSGTNNVKTRTMTLPAVLSGQNGSGTSATVVDEYDAYSNLIKRTDERGTVNLYEYDVVHSRVTKQTLNYKASPTGDPSENLVTDYTYDVEGRLIQTLGPSHEVDLGGTATTVRKATWTVYIPSTNPGTGTWELDQIWRGVGYATGSSPSYSYTLVDPVSISRNDKNGRTVDQIASKRTTGSGALSSGNTFVQTDWRSWSSSQYNNQGQLTSSRVYHLIPSSGEGSVTTNYGQTDYGYDALERRNKVKAAGGTISRTVWATPQRVASVWVGTDDTGATDSNPAGSGSPNNMVVITENQYDGGSDGGDGNLTQVTQYAAASDTRVTSYTYDFRDRRISMDGEIDVYEEYTYDNLDRMTKVDRKNTNSGGNLIGRSETKYDDRGRVYQTITYAVTPSTGAVGNALTSNTWYDDGGNVLQRIDEGAGQVFNKNVYNGGGWLAASYAAYNPSGTSYSQAGTVANDIIFEQSENTYDEAGNLIAQASYQRLNDAPVSGTGSTGALSAGTNPKARVSYTANWFDGIDRVVSSANYGAISSFTRPSTPPTRSDTILVTDTGYDDAGRAYQAIDPKGIEARTTFDAAGRTTETIEDYGTSKLDRTTQFTYTLDNQTATLTAVNSSTGDQVTTYTYGTTLSDSDVARNDLLRYTDYPDSASGSDRVALTYNRQGQITTRTDQRGVVRTFEYDKLGRPLHDRVTTLSTAAGSVKRLTRAYEVRGIVNKFSSYDNPTVGSGSIVNEVTMDYNAFAQLTKESQSHSGAVSSSPNVQYAYASGASSSNQIRPTSITYPNGRQIDYNYGTANGPDDRLSRVTAIKDGTTSLAAYTYLGAGSTIRIDYSQPSVRLDLWGGTSGTFAGIDRFNRVIDQQWVTTTGSPTDKDRYKYGYDRNSNRQWRQNTVGSTLDEYYTYDNVNRLTIMQRGTLTGSPPTGISGTPVKEQDWTLDPTGNWNGFVNKTSGTTDLNQSRTQNTVNEITAISASVGTTWATPVYDAAGNMTTIPKPSSLANSYTATYDPWNRKIEVKDGATTVATYAYDGRNRRITTTTSLTRHYYYNNVWQDIEERLGSLTTAERNHVWGIRYIDELVCRDRAVSAGSSSSSSSSGSAGLNERLYACQDANFNVTALLDTSGNVVERYSYEPYGTPTFRNNSWSDIGDSVKANTILYSGYKYDSETSMYYVRMRYLHRSLGGWSSRDRLGYVNTLNLFEAANDNPIRNRDPLGADPLDDVWDLEMRDSIGQYIGMEDYEPPEDPLDAQHLSAWDRFWYNFWNFFGLASPNQNPGTTKYLKCIQDCMDAVDFGIPSTPAGAAAGATGAALGFVPKRLIGIRGGKALGAGPTLIKTLGGRFISESAFAAGKSGTALGRGLAWASNNLTPRVGPISLGYNLFLAGLEAACALKCAKDSCPAPPSSPPPSTPPSNPSPPTPPWGKYGGWGY